MASLIVLLTTCLWQIFRLFIACLCLCASVAAWCAMRCLQRQARWLAWVARGCGGGWRCRCRFRRRGAILIEDTRHHPSALAVADSWVLPIRCGESMVHLQSTARELARTWPSKAPLGLRDGLENVHVDCAAAPAEVDFIRSLLLDSSDDASNVETSRRYSLVAPLLRVYMPHVMARCALQPTSLSVASVLATLRGPNSDFVTLQRNEARAASVFASSVFMTISDLYELCACGCSTHKPELMYDFARSITLGLQPLELFYFAPFNTQQLIQLCSKSSGFKIGTAFCSTLALALEQVPQSGRRVVDSALQGVLVCRVTLRAGSRMFVLMEDDPRPGDDLTFCASCVTNPPSLSETHLLLAFEPSCVQPVWLLTLEEARVARTISAPTQYPAVPTSSAVTSPTFATVRSLQVHAATTQLDLRQAKSSDASAGRLCTCNNTFCVVHTQ